MSNMKQHITVEQLSELSDEQILKVMKIKNKTLKYKGVRKYNGLLFNVIREDGRIKDITYTLNGENIHSKTHQCPITLSMDINIGLMCEIVNYRIQSISTHNEFWYVDIHDIDGSIIGFMKKELCDALLEAVKEVL